MNLNFKRAWTTGQCKSQSCGDTDKFELMIRRTKLLCEGRELGVQLGHSDPRDIKRNVDEVLATENWQLLTMIEPASSTLQRPGNGGGRRKVRDSGRMKLSEMTPNCMDRDWS